MAGDNMSAEQAPSGQGEVQHTTQDSNPRQPMQLAAEGAFSGQKPSFEEQDSSAQIFRDHKPQSYFDRFRKAVGEAQNEPVGLGGSTLEATIDRPGVIRKPQSSSGETSSAGGEGPHKFGRRELLISAGVATGAAVVAGAEIQTGFARGLLKRFFGGNSKKPNEQEGNAGGVKATETATKVPTPEATPTSKIEKYPIELGKTIDFGNVDVNLTKDLMETGALLDVNTGDVRKEGLKVQDVILNPDVPDAEQRLNKAILYGEFLAWQSQSTDRSNINFDQFKEKIDSGEDVSFNLYGYQDGDILAPKGEFKVDPSKKVHIVLTSTPSPNIQPFGGSKYGFRTINGELYLETYDYKAFGVGNKVHADSDIDVSICWLLALLPEKQVQKDEKLPQNEYQRVYARQQIFDKMLILKNSSEYWSGVLNVR